MSKALFIHIQSSDQGNRYLYLTGINVRINYIMTQMAIILILSIPNFTNHFEQIGEHNDGDNGPVRPTAAVDPFVRETF